MNLSKLTDFEPEYRKSIQDADILDFEVQAKQGERVGKVKDILINQVGQLYYLVVEIGSWLNHRAVLVAPQQFRIDRHHREVYLTELGNAEISSLPVYDPTAHEVSRRDLTPQKRVVERSLDGSVAPIEASLPLESSAALGYGAQPLERLVRQQEVEPVVTSNAQPAQSLPAQPALANHVAVEPQLPQPQVSQVGSSEVQATVRLLEERLVVDRHRRKIGEVIVRKEIETRIIEVPVRREKLVIEQISPERKQLATVDLPAEDLSDSQISEMVNSALKPTPDAGFVDSATAHRILTDMSQRANATMKVKLVFEDPRMQTEYQRRLSSGG